MSPLGLRLSLTAALLGCGATPETSRQTPAEQGEALFTSGKLSPSSTNVFSCMTCHDARPRNGDRLKPGAPLAGATARALYWGGQENDLLQSIDACRSIFMSAPVPLEATDPDADALYAFLVSLEPGDASSAPFSVVREISNVPRGDVARGQGVFERACQSCHGAMHTGEGRRSSRIPVLPEQTLEAHPAPDYSVRVQRLVFIEKTRHGAFLGYGGLMPPFSLEVLPDPALSDLLEGLGVLGE